MNTLQERRINDLIEIFQTEESLKRQAFKRLEICKSVLENDFAGIEKKYKYEYKLKNESLTLREIAILILKLNPLKLNIKEML